jgi:membrane protein DedA with SNARE-associated domain
VAQWAASPWLLVLVFAAVCLESAAFLGLFVPGESVVLLAGAAAGAGLLNPILTAAIVLSAAIVGDIAGYLIGRWWGPALLARWPFAARQYAYYRPYLTDYFERWGSMTVLFGRFLAVGRAFTPFAAGLSEMPARRFVPMAVISGLLWGSFFTAAGFLLGDNFRLIERWLRPLGAGMLGLVVLTLAMVWLWRWLQAHHDKVAALGWRLLESAPARRLAAPLGALSRWALERFSPSGYLGLHLSVGLLLIALLATSFGLIVHSILFQRPLVYVDQSVTLFLAQRHTPALDHLMAMLFWLAAPRFLLLVVGVAALSLLLAGQTLEAMVAMIAIVGAYLAGFALRELFEGISPHVSAAATVHGFADFPDINATAVAAGYGVLGYNVARWLRSWRASTMAAVASLYLIVLAALACLYRTSVLSAVVAGLAVGGCWLAICLTGMVAWRRLTGESTFTPAAPSRQSG